LHAYKEKEVIRLTHHLEPIYDTYLANKDLAPTSRKLYFLVLRQYVTYLEQHDITEARTADILRYRQTIRDKGFTSHYVYTQMTVIKGFYKYLRTHRRELGLPDTYAFDVAEAIKNPHPRVRIHKRMITLSQAKRIILTTKENRRYIWHYRDHAILYLMITTGLRSIEIRRARRKDYVRENGQWLLYVQGKGRPDADEYVKVTPDVATAIDDYLAKRQDQNPYLFIPHKNRSRSGGLSRTFFRGMFRRVLAQCGLDGLGLTPHALRHAAATFNLMRGGSLEATRQLLRHRSIDTTLVYAHHLERQSDDSERQIETFILKEEAVFWGDVWAQSDDT